MEHGVQRPSSSALHVASGGPASTRGSKLLEMVSFKPSTRLSGHGTECKQLQSLGKFGRGSSPKKATPQGIEPFTCRSMVQSANKLCKATVPTQLHRPPSLALVMALLACVESHIYVMPWQERGRGP